VAEATATSAGTTPPAVTTAQAERGRLDVRERVHSRVAALAACEVDGVVRVHGGLDAVTGRELPRVRVREAGGRVRLDVDVAVRWPVALDATALAVRDVVTRRVAGLTGATVDAVDVTVARVLLADEAGSDVRRVR
jgi:uncharacterized alkaline shock family protein YloU